MKRQQGFTLIELIIVIVVLGILAVTAAPQFINFSSDARESTVKGAQASIQGAMQLVYAKSLVEGNDSVATGETVATENGDVDIAFGYPEASDYAGAGIGLAAGLSSSEWVSDLAGTTPEEISFSQGSTFNATCSVTYTEAADATTPATVSVDVSAC
ncbi:type II secretion system protein [Pseudidiomarina sp. 1APP75-27a]|uniref:type II secretion system protein n=1 Tax=Pseudidiomarina terrestris TaxID=2820060 RepID=UPI00264FADEE|nr:MULTISPECIES: type II secretion system protein [unclassified Pseudidiomarina]MDN7126275.1 type II secretion system protein [Pseudidiomarina sp. 1APR75-33.1]MEA3587906.1 type II secretion system protein [Pseudidiomarina sp. 1APP75-27a]